MGLNFSAGDTVEHEEEILGDNDIWHFKMSRSFIEKIERGRIGFNRQYYIIRHEWYDDNEVMLTRKVLTEKIRFHEKV